MLKSSGKGGTIMKSSIFNANFISAPEEFGKICPSFMRTFTLKTTVKKAVLYISALGIYEAEINGKRVGTDKMAPGWTAYQKRLQVFSYDVKDMLQQTNVITVGLGNGWFASKVGFLQGHPVYNEFPALIASLELTYTDGSKELIVTDESWAAAKSETLESGIYDGEFTDARIQPVYEYSPVVIDYPKEVLIPKEGESVKDVASVEVKEVIYTKKGERVLDFGQNLTGTVEFTLSAKGGEHILIECAEILDNDGCFYNENYRTAKSRIEYIAKPGKQTHRTRYTFFGFRYLRVTGWPGEINPDDFVARVMFSDVKRVGQFTSGHAKLNKLYANVIRGQRGNFLDIPTDCPQRDERLGWTGDAQVFARTAMLNFDCEKFFTKWLRDVQAEQRDDGAIPHVVPARCDGYASAGWGDVACVLPWETYYAYGNKSLLKECLPMMKKWVEYIHKATTKKYLWTGGTHFGDWLGLDAPYGSYKGSTDDDLIATAYFYHSTRLVALALKELGYSSKKYDNLAKHIKRAFSKEFIFRGKLKSDTQTAHVLALHFGLVEDEKARAKIGRRLIELIEENAGTLTTGFIGTPYILDTLTEIGREDLAYKLLLNEQFPSWLFSVNKGATTIWEHWDGIKDDGTVWSRDMNSFNHYAYGSVAAWMYRSIAGIKPTSPAYKTVDISPISSRRLGHAHASIKTASGTIESGWTYEGDTVRYEIKIPKGILATVTIDGVKEAIGCGEYVTYSKAKD